MQAPDLLWTLIDSSTDYLRKFFRFTVRNLKEYAEKYHASDAADWRIKESLMHGLAVLNHQVLTDEACSKEMEEVLVRYILPELSSAQPFLRIRACETYCAYHTVKFADDNHLKQIVVDIFNNMAD